MSLHDEMPMPFLEPVEAMIGKNAKGSDELAIAYAVLRLQEVLSEIHFELSEIRLVMQRMAPAPRDDDRP